VASDSRDAKEVVCPMPSARVRTEEEPATNSGRLSSGGGDVETAGGSASRDATECVAPKPQQSTSGGVEAGALAMEAASPPRVGEGMPQTAPSDAPTAVPGVSVAQAPIGVSVVTHGQGEQSRPLLAMSMKLPPFGGSLPFSAGDSWCRNCRLSSSA